MFDSCRDTTCKPIVCLEDVLNWDEKCVRKKYKVKSLNRKSHETTHAISKNGKSKVILCHDMKGNYLEDRYFYGYDEKNPYRFYDWSLIDTFIYFSHYFITIPTESWTNAAHKNGVYMLGTVITEFDDGALICEALLSDESVVRKFVDKLVQITLFYGFDGWLLNIENIVHPEHIDNLVLLVRLLTEALHKEGDYYKVIWYDSVLKTGELNWQNELNDSNKVFFDACDGIFLNYTWKEVNLENSFKNAQNRIDDVWVGVDVFGRNCFGGGGFNCNLAFDAISKFNLNVALFAPGWVHEANDPNMFIENSQKFWSLIEKYCYKREITSLPFVSSFSQGCGDKFFVNGKLMSQNQPWCNLNLQTILPSLAERNELTDEKENDFNVRWCFDDAFYGGNCIEINSNKKLSIFDLDITVNANQILKVDYAFKNDNVKEDETQNKKQLTKSFHVILRYLANNESIEFDLSNNGQCSANNNQVELLKEVNEVKFESKWTLRSYYLKIKNMELKLKNILLNNEQDLKTKVGLLRIRPASTEYQKIEENYKIFDFKLLSKKLMRLVNKHFYFIEFSWNYVQQTGQDEIGFNVFLRNTNNENLVFVGSTKEPKFMVCLELIDYRFGTLNDDRNKTSGNSINLFVHPVNSLLEIDEEYSLKDEQFLKVSIPGNAKINKLVYDFETL